MSVACWLLHLTELSIFLSDHILQLYREPSLDIVFVILDLCFLAVRFHSIYFHCKLHEGEDFLLIPGKPQHLQRRQLSNRYQVRLRWIWTSEQTWKKEVKGEPVSRLFSLQKKGCAERRGRLLKEWRLPQLMASQKGKGKMAREMWRHSKAESQLGVRTNARWH